MATCTAEARWTLKDGEDSGRTQDSIAKSAPE